MSRSAFGMGVDVRHPLFPHKVVCNALGFLLKCITRFSDVCQHKLIITLDIAGSIDRSTTIINLQQRPRKYSLHCFIAMNPDPKEKVSTEVCFLLNQWTKEQFTQTRKLVWDLLVTISDASASTLAFTVKPKPQGSGILGDNTSLPCKWPISLETQSLASNIASSITGSLGSYMISALWYFS